MENLKKSVGVPTESITLTKIVDGLRTELKELENFCEAMSIVMDRLDSDNKHIPDINKSISENIQPLSVNNKNVTEETQSLSLLGEMNNLLIRLIIARQTVDKLCFRLDAVL